MNKDVWGALTGIAFLLIVIVAFVVIGDEPPDANSNPQDIVDYYVDNKDTVQVGAVIAAVAGALLVFFGAYLRKVFSAAGGEMLPPLALAGTAIVAVGMAIDNTISFALSEAAEDIDPVAVQAMQAIWDNDFLPMVLGMLVLMLSSGLSIIRHGALPKWLGWVAIVLAVAMMTPAGFIGFIGSVLWVAIVSVMLALRARTAAAA